MSLFAPECPFPLPLMVTHQVEFTCPLVHSAPILSDVTATLHLFRDALVLSLFSMNASCEENKQLFTIQKFFNTSPCLPDHSSTREITSQKKLQKASIRLFWTAQFSQVLLYLTHQLCVPIHCAFPNQSFQIFFARTKWRICDPLDYFIA
jgi:hypothetical protein